MQDIVEEVRRYSRAERKGQVLLLSCSAYKQFLKNEHGMSEEQAAAAWTRSEHDAKVYRERDPNGILKIAISGRTVIEYATGELRMKKQRVGVSAGDIQLQAAPEMNPGRDDSMMDEGLQAAALGCVVPEQQKELFAGASTKAKRALSTAPVVEAPQRRPKPAAPTLQVVAAPAALAPAPAEPTGDDQDGGDEEESGEEEAQQMRQQQAEEVLPAPLPAVPPPAAATTLPTQASSGPTTARPASATTRPPSSKTGPGGLRQEARTTPAPRRSDRRARRAPWARAPSQAARTRRRRRRASRTRRRGRPTSRSTPWTRSSSTRLSTWARRQGQGKGKQGLSCVLGV